MQNSQLFRSFFKKKQLISNMITESKSPKNRDQFKHFSAVSQPTLIKAQSNAMYLSHLNTQFKDHLREFVHEQQSFNQTMSQLNKISQTVQKQLDSKQAQYKMIKTQSYQFELQKQVLTTKSNSLLQKIVTSQQQIKLSNIKAEQYQKIATSLQQDIQFQSQVLTQIKNKNHELIQKLQVKAGQIQFCTSKMQAKQKNMRTKQSQLKKFNSDIKSIYFTLQSQDNVLSTLCDQIESNLNKQNNYINDVEFVKNDLLRVLTETQNRKNQLKQQENTHDKLMNYFEDLTFQTKRVAKQLEIQQKGIDEEYWKIQQQQSRLQQNRQMLLQLQEYLQELVRKNQMLQQSLQEQIIQDHTIKRIVDSKCNQPIGMKTKIFLQEAQQKQMRSTGASFKQNSTLKQNSTVKQNLKSMKISRLNDKNEVKCSKVSKHVPQQMQFVFQKFINKSSYDQTEQQQQSQLYYQSDSKLMNTGFSYIHGLTKLQIENN